MVAVAAGDWHYKDPSSIFKRSAAYRTFIFCMEHNVVSIIIFYYLAFVLTFIDTDADVLPRKILQLPTLFSVKASILELRVLSCLLLWIRLMVVKGHKVHYRHDYQKECHAKHHHRLSQGGALRLDQFNILLCCLLIQ